MNISRLLCVACLLISAAFIGGCGQRSTSTDPGTGLTKTDLTLDWKPEPEFGGFYAAQQNGAFARQNLDVNIQSAGEGAPTWQLVATGKTEFATTAADQVIIGRNSGADVVAIFAVYQTFPQGIMVHKSRGFTKIADVFNSDGLLLAEDDTWLTFLRNKFSPVKVKIQGYDGGIATFLAKPDCSQQCFITSEPILARHQNSDPQTFLIADDGYNPYTTVVICRGATLRMNPAKVRAMVTACRDGWRAYLDDPSAANTAMEGLNKDMDPQTFTEAAQAQKPLIETAETTANGLGTMTKDRWDALAKQLIDLKVIDKAPASTDCFVNP